MATRQSILDRIPRVLGGGSSGGGTGGGGLGREVTPTIPGGGAGADDSLRDAVPNLGTWKPLQFRQAGSGQNPPSARQIAAEAFFRVHRRLPDWLQGQWDDIVGSEAGRAAGLDTTFAKWQDTPLGREFAGSWLPNIERSAGGRDWYNIPDITERIALQQAKRQERVVQDYYNNQGGHAAARELAINADPHAAGRNTLATELARTLAGLRAELSGNLDITADPSYRFRRRESLDALDSAFAAAGQLHSGARARALQERAGELASQEYGAAHARRLADIAARRGLAESGYSARAGALDRLSGLYQTGVGERYDQLQEAEATRLQGLLNAIGQYGGGAGAALEYIADDQERELARLERERLEALNIELTQQGLAQQERASRRSSRDARLGAILGAVGNIGGAALGGLAQKKST